MAQAIDQAIADGRIADLLALAGPLKDLRGDAGTTLREHLLRPTTIARLLADEPLDADALERLMPLLSISSHNVLLDALAESENRATRRKLIDRLAHATQDITPLITKRLEDPRWYVRRNMLLLLERLGKVPPGFSVTRWTLQEDPRVRQEAVRLQLTLPREREQALRTALADSHPRMISIGLAALQKDCPSPVVHLVARVAGDQTGPDDLRLLAIRALGRSREPLALDTLLQIVDGGKSLLGRPKLAAKSPACVAAIQALAIGWPANPRARTVLNLAAQSNDPELRSASLAYGG
jgi:hypothetical protein